MKRVWCAACGVVIGVLMGAVGCGPSTPAEKAQENIATMQRESSAANLLDRGRGFASIGDMTRAEEYFAAAINQGADYRTVMPLLIQVCVQDGRYRSAVQYAEEHLRRHPDDIGTRFVLGTLYVALGEAKPARVNLERVAKAKPNDSKAQYALGVLARDTEQDVVLADLHFREYLRIEPNGTHAEEARASLLKRMP